MSNQVPPFQWNMILLSTFVCQDNHFESQCLSKGVLKQGISLRLPYYSQSSKNLAILRNAQLEYKYHYDRIINDPIVLSIIQYITNRNANKWKVCKNKITKCIVFHIDGLMQKDVTPLLTHWSYVFLALTHRYIWSIIKCISVLRHHHHRRHRRRHRHRHRHHHNHQSSSFSFSSAYSSPPS